MYRVYKSSNTNGKNTTQKHTLTAVTAVIVPMNIYIGHTYSMHQMWNSNLMNSMQYAICSKKHSAGVGKDQGPMGRGF